jgi:predicted nucleic acid-binding protein
MIVLDASAATEWLLQTPTAAAIEARLFSKTAQTRWHAPHLLDVEVAQVLRKQVAQGVMSDARRHYRTSSISRWYGIRTISCCRGYGSFTRISPPTTPSTSRSPKRSGFLS